MKDVDQFWGVDMNPDNKEWKKMKTLLNGDNITGITPDIAGKQKWKWLDSPTMWEISRI